MEELAFTMQSTKQIELKAWKLISHRLLSWNRRNDAYKPACQKITYVRLIVIMLTWKSRLAAFNLIKAFSQAVSKYYYHYLLSSYLSKASAQAKHSMLRVILKIEGLILYVIVNQTRSEIYININSVVEFQRWWVLKSKLFGQESTCHQGKEKSLKHSYE